MSKRAAKSRKAALADEPESPPPIKAASFASSSKPRSRRRAAADDSRASTALVNTALTSLSRLADVELQLICHSLSATDILRLGRCNVRMRRVVDAPFAWRTGQMVTVASNSQEQLGFVQHGSAHPARHAALCVRWLTANAKDGIAPWDSIAALAAAVSGRVHGLDASGLGTYSTRYWSDVLRHPFAQQLRALRLHRAPQPEVSTAEIDLICALPLLHTLEILPTNMDYAERWSSLPSAPSLRCLTICDSTVESVASASPYVARCPKLVQLRYESPGFHRSFRAFFSQLTQLESLVIDSYIAAREGGPSAEDYAAVWTMLTRLHHLHLRRVWNIDLLLPSIALCPSLRTLLIEPSFTMANAAKQMTVPSLKLIRDLLTAKPQLQLRLQFDARLHNEAIPDQRKTQTAQMKRAFPGRFHIAEVWCSPFQPNRSFDF